MKMLFLRHTIAVNNIISSCAMCYKQYIYINIYIYKEN